jgi:hypothetical protein
VPDLPGRGRGRDVRDARGARRLLLRRLERAGARPRASRGRPAARVVARLRPAPRAGHLLRAARRSDRHAFLGTAGAGGGNGRARVHLRVRAAAQGGCRRARRRRDRAADPRLPLQRQQLAVGDPVAREPRDRRGAAGRRARAARARPRRVARCGTARRLAFAVRPQPAELRALRGRRLSRRPAVYPLGRPAPRTHPLGARPDRDRRRRASHAGATAGRCRHALARAVRRRDGHARLAHRPRRRAACG